MAKLPGLDEAVVPQEKVRAYLLSASHPAGRSKASFFSQYGFTQGAWSEFADALVRHAAENEVAAIEESRFGAKYTIEGRLETRSGRNPVIRAVWFLAKGTAAPRLVTAYPFGAKEHDDEGT